MIRPWGALVSVALIGAVLWPLARDPLREDSFPLSTYPMFARPRPEARVVLDYVVALGPGGARRQVPPGLVATDEPMQAMMTIQRAVRGGHARTLCAEVAARVARAPGYAAMDEVAVVTGDHRAVALVVRGERGPEREHARCPIAREPR